jgi:PAS domain S-box-containing protein
MQADEHTSAHSEPSIDALRQAFNAAPDGILIVDATGAIVVANPRVLEMFGYTAGELVGAPVETLVPVARRDKHVHQRAGYIEHPRSRPMGSGLDLRGRRKSGEEFPVEISLSPSGSASRPDVVAVVRDVTDRRRQADELRRAQEELAIVDERERIARDLHDTVIQRLFAIGLSLQAALTKTTDEKMIGRVDTAIAEIDGTIRDVRTAIFSLQTRRTLVGAVRDDLVAVTRDAARALGFEPHVVFDGLIDSRISDEVRDQLIPTLREALSNVARHAHASRVTVTVTVDDRRVQLLVEDDGSGIPPDVPHGHGLRNMGERAFAVGGECDVHTAPDGGTAVEWWAPLS